MVGLPRGTTKSPLGRAKDRITRACETCGTSFTTQVQNVEKGKGRFCSRKCNPARYSTEPGPPDARRNNIKHLYGISAEQFDEMARKQNNKCAICGGPPSPRYGRLFVDHCHSTKIVRGLLCTKCNTGLGLFSDDTAILRRAIQYLTEA